MNRHHWRHLAGLVAAALFFTWAYVMNRRVLGADSPWLGLVPMFFALAIARLAQPLLSLRLPTALQRLWPWESDARVERRLGILAFGRALRRTPLRHLNPSVYLARGPGAGDLVVVLRHAESGEAAHWIGALVLMPSLVQAVLASRWGAALVLLLVQLAVNVYPILHLRHVRVRLTRAQRLAVDRRPDC